MNRDFTYLKNLEFRRKLMKGAKIEDLYFYIEELKKDGIESEQALREIQRFIQFQLGYEPVEEVKA